MKYVRHTCQAGCSMLVALHRSALVSYGLFFYCVCVRVCAACAPTADLFRLCRAATSIYCISAVRQWPASQLNIHASIQCDLPASLHCCSSDMNLLPFSFFNFLQAFPIAYYAYHLISYSVFQLCQEQILRTPLSTTFLACHCQSFCRFSVYSFAFLLQLRYEFFLNYFCSILHSVNVLPLVLLPTFGCYASTCFVAYSWGSTLAI